MPAGATSSESYENEDTDQLFNDSVEIGESPPKYQLTPLSDHSNVHQMDGKSPKKQITNYASMPDRNYSPNRPKSQRPSISNMKERAQTTKSSNVLQINPKRRREPSPPRQNVQENNLPSTSKGNQVQSAKNFTPTSPKRQRPLSEPHQNAQGNSRRPIKQRKNVQPAPTGRSYPFMSDISNNTENLPSPVEILDSEDESLFSDTDKEEERVTPGIFLLSNEVCSGFK